MVNFNDINTQVVVPEPEQTVPGTAPEPSPPSPADVVPPEIQRELPPHTEVRLVYWLRREYWTRLITPVVSTFEQRKAQ